MEKVTIVEDLEKIISEHVKSYEIKGKIIDKNLTEFFIDPVKRKLIVTFCIEDENK